MATQPSFDRLKAQLLVSGIQSENPALYQVLNALITAARQSADATNETISSIESSGEGFSPARVMARVMLQC